MRSKTLVGLVLTVLVTTIFILVAGQARDRELWGDEGTFVAMAASLVGDRDLVFGDADLERLLQHPDGFAPTVILQRTGQGITFSKPLLYPLISVPLFAVVGEAGMVATNAATLALALVLTFAYLRPLASSARILWTLGTFVGASVVLVYLSWKMSDLVLLSLTLAGLILALGGRQVETENGRRETRMPFGGLIAALMGGLVLGSAVTMRYTTAALAAAAVVALMLDRRWRRAMIVGVTAVAGFLAISLAAISLTGTANPYKAQRSSFNQATGYPAGPAFERASERFATRPATQSATWKPPLDLRRTGYSTFYFLIGRHTGILVYFPAAIALLLAMVSRPDRISLSLLVGVLAILGFYLLWMPENYFGGSTFVGNRYFLGAFPALLVAATRLPTSRQLAAAWTVALIAWSSAAYSVRSVQDIDRSSQAHAHAGLFRSLPFESTAQRIDGLTERFWAEDYVRFLDPFPEVAPLSFRLDSARPEAELLIATDRPDSPIHFVVSPSVARVDIEVRDWQGRSRFALPLPDPDPPGLLAFTASRSWRSHSYWWRPHKPYHSTVLRLSLDQEGKENAKAVVRYAGRGRDLAPLGGQIVRIRPPLPSILKAGSETVHTLEIRNSGRRPWKREGLFPVQIGYRLIAESREHSLRSEPLPLPKNVPPGEVVLVPLTLRWPAVPGPYQVSFDLLRRPVGALKSLGRLVLQVEDVQITAELSPDNPAP